MDFTWMLWLPLGLLFLSTVIGALVKNRSRDLCLKKFDNCFVLIKTEDGRWFWGDLQVFSTCLELRFHQSLNPEGLAKLSYIFYEPEIQTIVSVIRPVPYVDGSDQQWQMEIASLLERTPGERALRQFRNLLNILRDAFSQSIGLLVGLVKTKQKIAAVPALDQRSTELGKHLLSVVPNAYEPILEKYLGHLVIVQSLKTGVLPEQVSILEEYTEKFLLVRDAPVPTDWPAKLPVPSPCHYDAVHARRVAVIRHLAQRTQPAPFTNREETDVATLLPAMAVVANRSERRIRPGFL
jgi:hypothetical protein